MTINEYLVNHPYEEANEAEPTLREVLTEEIKSERGLDLASALYYAEEYEPTATVYLCDDERQYEVDEVDVEKYNVIGIEEINDTWVGLTIQEA